MRPAHVLPLLACLGSALSAAAAPARKASALPVLHWYSYTVDSSSLQAYSRVRFDSEDSIKIAYRGPDKSVRYAELASHRFRIQKVDAVAGSESKLDMAVDGDGVPHLYYQTSDNTKFVYARPGSGASGWTLTNLYGQSAPNLDYYMVAVEADADGDLHFAQSIFDTVGNDVNSSLSYFTIPKGGSRSALEFIDRTGRNGKWGGMSLHSDGSPILAYFDFAGANLAFSRMSGSGWVRRVIDSAQFDTKKGKFTTVRQKGDDFLITTLSEARKKIILITGKDTSWTIENVDDFPLFATFSTQIAMDLDSAGAPHLAYPVIKSAEEFTAATDGLVLARRDGSGWKMDTVDAADGVGEYASMDIGPSGRIAITYMDRKTFTLKLLVSSTVEPPDENEDGIPDYKQIPSSVRKKKAPSLGARASGTRVIDAAGRALPPAGEAAGKRPAAGAYFPGTP